jgi:hypothetical protein
MDINYGYHINLFAKAKDYINLLSAKTAIFPLFVIPEKKLYLEERVKTNFIFLCTLQKQFNNCLIHSWIDILSQIR